MTVSSLRWFSPLLKSLLCLTVLWAVGGCADQITYGHKYRREGQQLLDNKDYANAAGSFRAAVQQDPGDYQSQYYLGVCYEQLRQYQLAIKSYKMAMSAPLSKDDVELRPKMVDSLARCVAQYDTRDMELNALVEEARLRPSGESHLVLARIYRYRKDADSAMRSYQQAVAFDAKNFALHKEFGLYLLNSLDQKPQAELELRRAYGLNSEDEEVNAALRQLGVVPGPSLRDSKDLAKPPMPKGPLPDLNRPQSYRSSPSLRGPVVPRE